MERPPAETMIIETDEGFDELLEGFIPRTAIVPPRDREQELRCISSGYLSHGCRCELTIPASVVADAWERELAFGNTEDRFFRVVWRDEVWLAYGRGDGSVRGVHCPAHRAERDERSFDISVACEGDLNQVAPA